MTIARRAFAAGCGALPLLAGLFDPRRRRAWATGGPSPRRLLILPQMAGAIRGALVPTGAETGFAFAVASQPLEPWRSRLLVLDGIHNTAAEKHLLGDTHEKANSGLLTGATVGPRIDPPLISPSGSLDQFLGRQIQGESRLPSVELTVEVAAGQGPGVIYPPGGGYQMPMINKASQAFDRLFAGLIGSGSAAVDDAAIRKVRLLRQSVLDYVDRDLVRLGRRLGAEDRRKVDAHLTAIRDLERQLVAPVAAASRCSDVRRPPDPNPKDKTLIPAAVKATTDLVVQAFACDVTRLITYVPTNAGDFGAPWLGEERSIHLISHGKFGDWTDIGPRWLRWVYEQTAYLLQRMSEVPEGDGTLLDHTLILSMHEFGDSATHGFRNIFTVLIGDAGGFLRTGRFLTFKGKPHNNVLVTVANAMGVELKTFGEAALCDGGPMPELRA
jgi:hypothetical protein